MKNWRMLSLAFVFFAFSIMSCETVINETVEDSGLESYEDSDFESYEDSDLTSETANLTVISKPYFWGTWIRMDNGAEYEINETKVNYKGSNNSALISYDIQNSTESRIEVTSLGAFEKQSESVMIMKMRYSGATTDSDIPLFRKGGANLNYKLKVVGFNDNLQSFSRAASASGGIKVKGTSKKYTSYVSEADTDDDGMVTLKAPVAGDEQTVFIENNDNKIIVEGLKVNNDGDFMGTIPLANGEKDYTLKVTGDIKDKTDGYLYADKTYSMDLTITNISDDISSMPSVLKIAVADKDKRYVTITPADANLDFAGISVSTLKPKAYKKVTLNITSSNFTAPYMDITIEVTITNSKTRRTWVDFVPLRIYRGQFPIAISAASGENNTRARLNGFLIYPDGNNEYFSVAHNETQLLYVPTFSESEPYTMVFSGATSFSGDLMYSNEMYYTVNLDSFVPRTVVTTGASILNFQGFAEFGYGNETENTAYQLTSTEKSLEAYLYEGDIDFYKFYVNTNASGYIGQNGSSKIAYTLSCDETTVTSHTATLSYRKFDNRSTDISLYLYTKTGTSYEKSLTASTSERKIELTGLEADREYTYVIKNSKGAIISNECSFRTKKIVPPANVTGLTCSPANPNYTLSWTPVADARSYDVYYMASDSEANSETFGIAAKKLNSGVTSNTFTIQSSLLLTEAGKYIHFAVKARNEDAESQGFSNIVTVTNTTNLYGRITQIPSAATRLNQSLILNEKSLSVSPQYFYFATNAGTEYTIKWADSDQPVSGKYTLDVKVSCYAAGLTSPGAYGGFSSVDRGYDYPYSFKAKITGYYVIKVEPYYSGNSGTYAIAVY